MICLPVAESRLPVGSSARSSGGPARHRARHRHALLLAARELHRVVVGALGQAHLGEQRGRARGRVGLAGQLERHRHVLQRGERRDEMEGLEDVADVVAAEARELVLVEAR